MARQINWALIEKLADVDYDKNMVILPLNTPIQLTEDDAWGLSTRLQDLSMRLAQTRLRKEVILEQEQKRKEKKMRKREAQDEADADPMTRAAQLAIERCG